MHLAVLLKLRMVVGYCYANLHYLLYHLVSLKASLGEWSIKMSVFICTYLPIILLETCIAFSETVCIYFEVVTMIIPAFRRLL